MILAGRYGEILYDPAPVAVPAAPVAMANLKTWKLSQKTDQINVTCFNNANKRYVMGLKDISGSVGGFWDSEELALFEAVDSSTPGLLRLVPNKNDLVGAEVPAFEGLAYLDVDIDTDVEGAPAITGNFVAAGDWTLNLLVVLAAAKAA